MEAEIRKALKKVFDPEIRINVVDLGLIYKISDQKGEIAILMTFTSPFCPYGPALRSAVRQAAKKVKGVKQVIVKLTLTPPWTPEQISKEARLQLKLLG